MISKKLTLKSALGLSLVLGASAASPLEARSSSTTTRSPTAASIAPVNSLQVRQQRYCVVEFIHSRIPKKICKTEIEWIALGVDLPEAR
jgi:hypothetical protein